MQWRLVVAPEGLIYLFTSNTSNSTTYGSGNFSFTVIGVINSNKNGDLYD
jgi:hypothetical protein